MAFSKDFVARHESIQAQRLAGGQLVKLLSSMVEHRPFMPNHKNLSMFHHLDTIYNKPFRLIEKYPECRTYWEEGGWYSYVQAPKPNELRVAFLGDSVTQGANNILVLPHYMGNMQTFLTNQPDGSNTNMGGWAYYAH